MKRIAGVYRKGGTLGVHIFTRDYTGLRCPVVQFSFKAPWWLPKVDKHYFRDLRSEGKWETIYDYDGWLAGWLFFYVGVIKTDKMKK